MNCNGIHLTLEALLSLILLVLFISVPFYSGEKNGKKLDGLYIIQKENDLLKVWMQEKELNEDVLKEDFEFVFPENNGVIEINGKKLGIGKSFGTKEVISSKASFFINGILYEMSVSVNC